MLRVGADQFAIAHIQGIPAQQYAARAQEQAYVPQGVPGRVDHLDASADRQDVAIV